MSYRYMLYMSIWYGFSIVRLCEVSTINPFKPEFTIVIFTHYKSRIAVAILDL